MGFEHLGLDPLWIQSAKRRGFVTPTPIQRECIPAVLKGHDVLALSKTGTGKTLAYVLPILHKLQSTNTGHQHPWSVLVLVPTKELILQVHEEFKKTMQAVAFANVRVSAFYRALPTAEAESKDMGSIVICTPRQISSRLHSPSASNGRWLENIETLVIDEADLLLSYGYDADMKSISPRISRSCQCILASATQSPDLNAIVKLVMENPQRIDLLGAEQLSTLGGKIEHSYLKCPPEEKALHVYALIQFHSVDVPTMIFVNSIHEGYRLHLFLDCFRIASSLLHRELPQDTRQRLIEVFNKGRCDVFIIVDDLQSHMSIKEQQKGKAAMKRTPKEVEFGVARGLDFKNVKTVLNVDLPQTVNGYLHRVGRTGRAGRSGLALSLFTRDEDEVLRKEIARQVDNGMASEGGRVEEAFHPFLHFNPKHIDALRYRASDVFRAVNAKAIRDARRKDIRQEILRSSDVSSYLEAHPEEKRLFAAPACANLKRRFADIEKLPSYVLSPESAPRTTGETKKPKSIPKVDPLSSKASLRRRSRGRRGRI